MSIKKNFTYNFIYHLLILIIPLLTMPYVARVLGVEGVGIYSYTHAVANYFVLFAMLGLNIYGNRSIAKVRDNKVELSKTFWSIYFFQFITSLVAIILYLIYVFTLEPQFYVISFIQVLFVISVMFDINWLFFGIEKFKLTVIRNTVVKVLALILIYIFVNGESDLALYTLIMAVSFLLSNLLLWPYLKNVVIWKRPTFNEVTNHIKPVIILFVPAISISIYKIMDKIMIGSMSDVTQLGYYTNALQLNLVQISLATSLGMVMMPRMSNIIARGDVKKYNTLIRNSMQFVLFLSTALCFGLIAISSDFIPIYLGESFLPSIEILILLAPTGIIISWANVIRTQYLLPNHKDKIYVISVILGAIVNISVNFLLIPEYGAIGAAIGTIIAEGTVMIYQTILVRKNLDISQYFKDSFIFFPIGITMFICIKIVSPFVGGNIMGIILQIIIGALIYLSLTAIYFVVFKKSRYRYFIGLVFPKNFNNQKNL